MDETKTNEARWLLKSLIRKRGTGEVFAEVKEGSREELRKKLADYFEAGEVAGCDALTFSIVLVRAAQ